MGAEMISVMIGSVIAPGTAMAIAVIMHHAVIVIAMLRHSVRSVAIFAIEAGEHAECGGEALKRQHRKGQGQDQFSAPHAHRRSVTQVRG